MSVRASRDPADSATVVTSQEVRDGRVDDHRRWQGKTDRAVRAFDEGRSLSAGVPTQEVLSGGTPTEDVVTVFALATAG
ncbi:hypothetical protein [Streptomyces sp. SP18CS02]|uniref:hypothetical protein n=1 Tax=Streptomyces sp. SP18CS02 TaxID=3002531 RepID=UPI002E796D82|nr:hypothetical protein [Streptomyces sp. SP18CS02]MEE1754612.1 hypothetical protein [Streptomyces sp. SP18CS02]